MWIASKTKLGWERTLLPFSEQLFLIYSENHKIFKRKKNYMNVLPACTEDIWIYQVSFICAKCISAWAKSGLVFTGDKLFSITNRKLFLEIHLRLLMSLWREFFFPPTFSSRETLLLLYFMSFPISSIW